MSSGHPEGPSTNPDDWKSPYGTGPGQVPGHGTGPVSGHGPAQTPGYGPDLTAQGPGQEYPPPPAAPGHLPHGADGYGYGGYGEPSYGHYPPGYGYGAPPYHNSEGLRTHAIVALVISLVLALSCYVTLGGIAGAILSGIALGKVDTDPWKARSLLRWTWVGIGVNVVLLVLGVAAFVVAGMNGVFS